MGLFHLKEGDTLPILEVALKDPDGTAHDLTGSTGWKLHVRLAGGGGAVVTRNMVKQGPDVDGVLRYSWAAADWSSTPALVVGQHRMEYEVLGPGAARLTFPNDGWDELRIVEDLGQG